MKNLRTELIQFINILEEIFPYSTMDKNFGGKHHITLNEQEIQLGIWYNNKIYKVLLEENDFVDFKKTMIEVKNSIQ